MTAALRFIPILTYDVETEDGQKVGRFEVVSRWEGFAKLVEVSARKGAIVCEDPAETGMGGFFREAFGDAPRPKRVISASPSVLEAFAKKEAPGAEG